MISFDLSVTGLDKVGRVLAPVASVMKDFRPIFKAIRPVLQEAAEERFASEGGRDGTGWAPLSPEYAARKAKTHGGRGILVRDGSLKASLAEMNGPGQVYRETDTMMTWGTSVPYGEYHQLGTGRMPAREIIRVTANDEAAMTRAATEAVMDLVRRAGA